MYQITCDDKVIYDIRSKDRKVLSPKLVLEVKKNGTLSFKIPKTNPMYDQINLKKSIFRVYQVDLKNNQKIYTQIFRGMPFSREEDFYSRGQIECEGELSFFNDTIVRPYTYKGNVVDLFRKYVNEHNSKVQYSKKFIARNCDVKDNNDYITRSNENYPSTKSEMDNKLIDYLGGHFETEELEESDEQGNRIKKVYIDYLQEYSKYNAQPIVFGKNTLDFSKFISAENIKTAIIPLGQKKESEYVTIKSVNNNLDYICDQAAVDLFGFIEGTVIHEDVTVPSNLLAKGKKDLEDAINQSVTINVKASDLHELDVNVEALRVGRMTRVISRPHKWDRYMLLSKLELNLDDIKSSNITLGAVYKTFTEKQLQSKKEVSIISSVAQKVESISADMSNIKNDISDINTTIVEIPTEYVKTETFNNFKTEINNKVGRVYKIKGSVASYNVLLSLADVEIGDVYNCKDTGANYVFTEEGWDKFSENYDFSVYVTEEEANNKFATITNLNELIARVEELENKGGTN